jgi:hypothetical protein
MLGGLLAALLGAGCRTPAPLPPVDLQRPGWTLRQGQAVWTPAGGKPGVAGELLAAHRGEEACFVQFSKPPFTLASAQAQAGAWAVSLPLLRRRQQGQGPPPARCVWFALIEATAGRKLSADWRFESRGAGGWLLENVRSGETLEGYFEP